jgi:hypothetical protein
MKSLSPGMSIIANAVANQKKKKLFMKHKAKPTTVNFEKGTKVNRYPN